LSEPTDGSSAKVPGSLSRAEILSQPRCWAECLQDWESPGFARHLLEPFRHAKEWLFVGCGSSYYASMAAAGAWTALTGQRARAVPASELMMYPELTLAGSEKPAAVVISRSGRTSEALFAAELLERDRDVRVLGVTCAAAQPLAQIASRTLTVLPADEQSTVMTRSFTSMLLGLQYLASSQQEDDAALNALRQLPERSQNALTALDSRVRDFVGMRDFDDYICLGQGAFFGLACECALKVTEMSVSYAQSFHTLEFRHGPKSVVGPETAILFLLSHPSEEDVLREMKALGGTTLTVVQQANDRVRHASDLCLEFDWTAPAATDLAPYVFAGQLVGLYTGLKKGFDPDHPRNLTRVVVLQDDPSQEPFNAPV
jgi:glucosamine--fructose-6-phosphate aminotransferase (isomerizing)